MRRLLTVGVVLVALPVLAQTKVFLLDSASSIQVTAQATPGFTVKRANSTQGASAQTAITAGSVGPYTGHYWPTVTTNYLVTKTSGGVRLVWLSDPLSAGVTIAGTITPNVYCLEAATSNNAGFRYEVLRWTPAKGVVSSLGISGDSGVTECATSTAAVRTAPTLTPTSTAFAAGDRIVIVLYNDDAATTTRASGNLTISYGAATGVVGDTYLSFTETITFSSDTNNERPRSQ